MRTISLARTVCYLEFFVLFSSSPCDPSKWKSLCVSMPTWGKSLTARVDNVNTAGSYAKVEPHFPRILKHFLYVERTWCITIARIKLRLCISGVPERADITVRNVERKFLRINHITMENACKIITLISYEMFRRLYCRCSRPALMQIANGIFNKRCLELHVLWI